MALEFMNIFLRLEQFLIIWLLLENLSLIDLVMYAISNLSTNSSFNPFITLINMMTVKPSFSVFHSQLETYERILNQQSNLDKEKMFHATVAFVHKPGYTNTS